MDRIIRWVLVVNLLFTASSVFGFQKSSLQNSYIVTGYDSHEGLSLKTAMMIAASDDGYLYVATANGLLQMDGIHSVLHSVSSGSGFKTDRIAGVFALDDLILVQDNLYYLYEFRNGKARPLLHPVSGEHLQTRIVRKLGPDFFILDSENSYLWSREGVRIRSKSISSYDAWDALAVGDSSVYVLNTDGLYHMGEEESRKIDFPDYFNPDLTYTSWLEVSGPLLKVAGKNEIAAYNIQTSQWEKEFYLSVSDPNTEIIHTKELPGDRGLLVGTTNGFMIQKKDTVYPVYESSASLRYDGYFEYKGDEYLAAADGVWINHQKVFTPSSEIVDAELDREGNLWVTVMADGIYRISRNPFKNYTDPRITNTYSLVEADDGSFWVGSFENGLHQMYGNRIVRSFNMQNSPFPTNIIRSVAKLNDGTILVAPWGTTPFLLRGDSLHQEKEFWSLFGKRTNTVEGFYEDSEGRWWLGTLDGLFRKEKERYYSFFDKNKVTLRKVSKILSSPFSDDLVFCTKENGVVILRKNEFLFANGSNSGLPVHARDAYFLSEDTLLVATYEHGLRRYILNGKKIRVQSLNEQNGLPQTGFHQFLRDTTGHFWISSNNGLLRISEKDLLYAFDTGGMLTGQRWFRTKQGISEPEFNGGSQNTGLIDRNNNFWFTNLRGLVRFNPYKMNFTELHSDNIRIQQIISAGEQINVRETETTLLPETYRDLRIRFAHMSFNDNQTASVSYKLKRSNRWKHPEEPGLIQLSGLKSGTHTLLFSADPSRNTVLKTYAFRISPYWYETLWFRLAGVLAACGLLYLLFQRVKRKREQPQTVPDEAPDHAILSKQEVPSPDTQTQPEKILDFIHSKHTNPDLSVTMIADRLNTSKSALYREWNKHHDESITDYITNLRLQEAKQYLLEERYTISEVADMSGFNSQSYFAKVFKKEMGVTPTTYQSDKGR